MTSEIRANTLKNRVGLGTVSFTNTGPVVSGILTTTGDVYLGNDIYLTDDSGGYEQVEVSVNDIRVGHKHIHSEFGVWTRSTSVTDRKNGIESGSNDLRLYSNSTEKVRITSTGRVGINETSPNATLHIKNADGANNRLELVHANDSANEQNKITFKNNTTEYASITSGKDGSNNSIGLAFGTGTTERLRIDSSGRLLVGTNTSRGVGDLIAKIQLEGNGFAASSLSLISNAGASAGNTPHLTLGKSRGSSTGSNTIVASNDALGQIQFAGADGTDCNSVAASIIGRVDSGTPGSNDMPGVLVFSTTSDGASAPTERLRIDSSGNVQVKTDDVRFGGSGTLRINSGSTAGALNLDGGSSNHGGEINLLGGSNGGRILFRTGQGAGQQGEKMRLDENGRLYLGTTTEGIVSGDDLTIANSGNMGLTLRSTDSNYCNIYFSDATSGTGEYAGYVSYQHSTNSLQLATSSTERLRINSGGQVLVGTSTAPAYTNRRLTVYDSTNSGTCSLEIRGSSSGDSRLYFTSSTTSGQLGAYAGKVYYGHADNVMAFYTAGGERLRIDSSGRVGINETSPDGMLHLKGSIPAIYLEDSDGTYGQAIIEQNGDNLKIRQDAGNASSGSSSNIRFEIDGSERMRIENLGDNEFGAKFFNNKAIEFKSQDQGIFTNTWSISANTWTNFFSIPSYFQAWIFLNSTHNAGNSSALWSVSKSLSGGSTATRLAYDNAYGPATVDLRINGVWVQLKSSYATYGYAIINCCAGGNGVANLSG